jgi:hypothetical protein
VSPISSSQNVRTLLDFTLCVFQQLGRHRRNCFVDSCMKFDHTTKFWTEYLVLYIARKDKIQWGLYRVNEGATGLARPAQSTCLEMFYSDILSQSGPSVKRHQLVKRESLVKDVPFAGLQTNHNRQRWKASRTVWTVQRLLKACLHPSYAGYYLYRSLESVPTIACSA